MSASMRSSAGARWATTATRVQPGEKMEERRRRAQSPANACEDGAVRPQRACGEPLAGTSFATRAHPRGLSKMIIDRETFTELAVHLKLASDAVLTTARHLAVLSNGDAGPDEHWAGTLDSLMSMNTEITVMERILRALMEANREEESSIAVPDKKSEPLPS